jgi:hypothetical protein
MKNKFTVILIGLSTSVFAQSIDNQVISSGGDFVSRANGSLSSTIGEPCVETLLSVNVILTQGFHQPQFTITDISLVDNPDIMLLVYPNPTPDILHIKTNNIGFNYSVYDISGKVLLTGTVETEEVSISLKPFSAGTFFLGIYSEKENIKKTYKISKL